MSIVIIFLLLYVEFRNAVQSGVVLLNLPLALIGGSIRAVVHDGRGEHTGHHRIHIAVRHSDAKRQCC